MPDTAVTGAECKLYRNTGTYAVPVWNEITIVRDLNAANTKTPVEATRRSKKYKEYLPGFKDISIDFDMLYDPSVDDYDTLLAAYTDDTLVDIAQADGAIASSGTRMLRMDCYLFDFSSNEEQEGAKTVNVVAKPAYSTSHTPTYSEVA